MELCDDGTTEKTATFIQLCKKGSAAHERMVAVIQLWSKS